MTKLPVLRISLNNATLLSAVYLIFATLTELVRRQWNPRWLERVSLSLEAFPARTLELLGVFDPIQRAWALGRLSQLEVRFIYAGTTVAVIFALGFFVGGLMWGVAKLVSRRGPDEP